MKQYLVVDIDRCWGCKSCQTACKREHGYPPQAEDAIEVFRIENVDGQGRAQCDFVPVLCQQCADPACVRHCPVHALRKEADGRVALDKGACIQCGRCLLACPYSAMCKEEPSQPRSTVIKCDLCVERRARGLLPACVQHCMGDALKLVPGEEMQALCANRRFWSCGQVVYLSSRLTGLGALLPEGGSFNPANAE